MVQTRNVQYGALIQSSDLPSDISSIMAPGRLVGMEFSVGAANQVSISPGACLLPDGVVILEDQTQTVLVNNTAFATSYTITYELQSTTVIGGSPANLNLLTGIVEQSTLTDSIVLGWVLYPGNSVALDESYFQQPAPVRVQPAQGVLHNTFVPPFADAIRPVTERPGSISSKSVRFSNLNSSQSSVSSFGGVPTRILNASVVTDSLPIAAVTSGNTSSDTFSVAKAFVVTGTLTTGNSTIANVSDTSKITLGQSVSNGSNGVQVGTLVAGVSPNSVMMSKPATAASSGAITFSDTIFSFSTATTGLAAGVPQQLIQTTGLDPSKFLVGPTDALVVGVNPTANPPAGSPSGEIDICVEMPGRSGNWQESLVTYGNETAWQFLNVGTKTLTYEFQLPFIVTGEGQPNKLITRLSVDANCLTTFEILVGGNTLTLTPNSGTAANTGGLVTNEFSIPNLSNVTWTPGTMAYIDVQIQAQPGGSAAFSFIGLTLENAPYLLFV